MLKRLPINDNYGVWFAVHKSSYFTVNQSQRLAILWEEVVLKITSLFGSTYRYEQFLKKMKHCKEKHKGHLSDSNADKNFVRGWLAATDVSLTDGIWHKAPVQMLTRSLRGFGGTWSLRPHSGCATVVNIWLVIFELLACSMKGNVPKLCKALQHQESHW